MYIILSVAYLQSLVDEIEELPHIAESRVIARSQKWHDHQHDVRAQSIGKDVQHRDAVIARVLDRRHVSGYVDLLGVIVTCLDGYEFSIFASCRVDDLVSLQTIRTSAFRKRATANDPHPERYRIFTKDRVCGCSCP